MFNFLCFTFSVLLSVFYSQCFTFSVYLTFILSKYMVADWQLRWPKNKPYSCLGNEVKVNLLMFYPSLLGSYQWNQIRRNMSQPPRHAQGSYKQQQQQIHPCSDLVSDWTCQQSCTESQLIVKYVDLVE